MNEISEMKAGPELDALVAEAMGLPITHKTIRVKEDLGYRRSRVSYRNITLSYAGNDYLQPYSTDIAAAWKVIEWMREHTTEKYTAPSLFSVPAGWSMVLYEKNDNHAPAWLDAFGETAPLAICRAALLAVQKGNTP